MCSSASFGFGSNVSIWLGPPSMNRQMQAFAWAAWWDDLGASGEVEVFSSAKSNEWSAAVPSERPSPYRKSRRLGGLQRIVQRTYRNSLEFMSTRQTSARDCVSASTCH